MNDRYLFRAKRTDNGEWIHGHLFDDGFKNGIVFVGGLVIEEYKGNACDDWNITGIDFYEIDPKTICQCTGLKDKNGKLIYENDILKGYKYPFFNDGYHDYFVKVIFSDVLHAFCAYTQQNPNLNFHGIYDGNIEYLDEFESENWEIIGNVFDNPELMNRGDI